MDVRELLIEMFDRIPGHVKVAVEGLDAEQLATGPEPGSNSVGWLVWHLTRVQDHHVAQLRDGPQVWETGNWAGRFGLTPDPHNTGYGHSPGDVDAVRPESAAVLIDYYDAVAAPTRQLLDQVTDATLDEVVDERWDPPVTLGVRLVSVADDDIQHAAQAAYVRGLLLRRSGSAAS
jgi:hypothetical protein